MHDAHTHIKDLNTLMYLKGHHVPCIVNASNLEEYTFLKKYQYQGMKISCGVHPWYAKTTDYNELLPFIMDADILGEIGLDQPWCDTPFEIQKRIFIKQLKLDQKVCILHTKGYEKEVLDIIRLFPRKYLVHWYSCKDYIDDYIELDCYFTIGPSIETDEAVRMVAKKVPLNRILIETDGLEAVEWAINKKVETTEYLHILENMMRCIAEIKEITVDELKMNLINNFEALTCI